MADWRFKRKSFDSKSSILAAIPIVPTFYLTSSFACSQIWLQTWKKLVSYYLSPLNLWLVWCFYIFKNEASSVVIAATLFFSVADILGTGCCCLCWFLVYQWGQQNFNTYLACLSSFLSFQFPLQPPILPTVITSLWSILLNFEDREFLFAGGGETSSLSFSIIWLSRPSC